MLQNARVRAFTVSELLRENQQEGGGKITPSPRLGLSANPMVKQTQTIRRLLPTNCLSVVDHFGGVGP